VSHPQSSQIVPCPAVSGEGEGGEREGGIGIDVGISEGG
jgi:hypothetical protein